MDELTLEAELSGLLAGLEASEGGLDQIIEQIDSQSSRENLSMFLRLGWQNFDRTSKYIHGWHIDCISDHLVAAGNGEFAGKHLLINIPPGMSKSSHVSVAWPAFEWARGHEHFTFMCIAYREDLALRDSRKCRDLISSPWYKAHFPSVQVRKDRDTAKKFENTGGGYRLALPTSGVMGEGGRFCFHVDTLVLTDKGALKIGDIVEGLLDVRVWTTATGAKEASANGRWSSISRYHRNTGKECVAVDMGDGGEIVCTRDHRFFVLGRGWVEAERLEVGDVVHQCGEQDVGTCSRRAKAVRMSGKAHIAATMEQAAVPVEDVAVTMEVIAGRVEGNSQVRCARRAPRMRSSCVQNSETNFKNGPHSVRKVTHLPKDQNPEATYCLTIPDTHAFFVSPPDQSTNNQNPQTEKTYYLAHNCIFDDPHNVREAESDDVREKVIDEISMALPTRIRSPEYGCPVTIMQRLHERDYAGYLLAELGEDIVHVCLPLEYDPAHPYPMKTPLVMWARDPRKEEGELLCPARYNEKTVAANKRALASRAGAYAIAGQYQQMPIPKGGGMFKKENWRMVDGVPAKEDIVGWARGWDLAASETKRAARTACVLGCIDKKGDVYVQHAKGVKKSAGKVLVWMKQCADNDPRGTIVDFPQDPGGAGKGQVAQIGKLLVGHSFKYSPETGDKEDRAQPAAAQQELGNMYLVRGPWNAEYIDELSRHPKGRYKDLGDATARMFTRLTTMYLNWKKRRAHATMSPMLVPIATEDPLESLGY